MADWALKTPVAFIIFDRPDATERVFAEIARARPPKLLVIADGPRSSRAGEAERCLETRAIIERVDWDCQVQTNYSDANLGCKTRVASGIDWVFEQVPEAIILEDDGLPHPSFFRFREELLVRYRDDERISQISGANYQFGQLRTDASYYFSRYNHIWGWAPEYVEAMHLLLQADAPDDYVIATGHGVSLETFVELAFAEKSLDWRRFVDSRQDLHRPLDLSESRADPAKANGRLGWRARYNVRDVVRMMINDTI